MRSANHFRHGVLFRYIHVCAICNICISMSRSTSRSFFHMSASAWMPRNPARRSHGRSTTPEALWVRGGSAHQHQLPELWSKSTLTPKSIGTNTARQFSTTSAEVSAYGASLCDDVISTQAMSNFGGLRYYNTGIDRRFRVLFILGGPGAGKGTQSALMEENYPVAHFSVGELLRNVPESSPHKTTIDTSLVAGKIVPVEISLALLRAAMEASAVNNKQTIFLVDGFPRNFDNLSGWCNVMGDVAALEAVVVYQCPLPVLQERILQRGKDSGRADDNVESAKKRFRTFESETVPVVERLRAISRDCPSDRRRWSVVDIAGDQSLDDVWQSTQQVLNELILLDVLTSNAALLTAIQAGDVLAYESLCDSNFFVDRNVATVMQEQEGAMVTVGSGLVEKAQVDVISGKQVAVSYDIVLNGVLIREKRFWTHQGSAGWRNVHFVRSPTATQ